MKDTGPVEPRDHGRGGIEEHDPPLRVEGNQPRGERFAQDIRKVQDILPEACGSFAFNVHLAVRRAAGSRRRKAVSEWKQYELRALEGFHNQKFGSKVRLEYPSAPPRQFLHASPPASTRRRAVSCRQQPPRCPDPRSD